MENNIIIALSIMCATLIILLLLEKRRGDKDCAVLLDALEEEQLLRSVERAVTNIMIQNRDLEIEELKSSMNKPIKEEESV